MGHWRLVLQRPTCSGPSYLGQDALLGTKEAESMFNTDTGCLGAIILRLKDKVKKKNPKLPEANSNSFFKTHLM